MNSHDKQAGHFPLSGGWTDDELRRSERRFRRITEGLIDYIYTVVLENEHAVQTTHSPACSAVTGYTASEFDSDPYLWINMVISEDRDKVLEQIRQTLAGEKPVPVEHRIIRKDGALRWVRNTIVPELDGQGKVLAYDGLITDISERKKMEEALRDSEARVRGKLFALLSPEGDIGSLDLEDIVDIPELQLLMDDFYALTKIGSAIVDVRGKVLVATGWQDICTKFHRVHPETSKNCIESDVFLSCSGTPGVFNLYKCKNNMWDMATPLIVGGKHLGNIFLGQFIFEDEEPDLEVFQRQARKYGFNEQKYLEALKNVPRFSRETVHLAMTFYARLGNLISELSFGHVKLARAMNEKSKAKEELKRLNVRLEQTLADKDKIFSIIAHDLRAPFIGFHNFIRLMDKHIHKMSHDDIRKLTSDMKTNADNLFSLLNNLLEWAKVQRGMIAYEPEPLDLDEIVRQGADLIEQGLRQKEISLSLSVPGSIIVFADKSMVGTVIRNLLSNAVKYTKRQGKISINAQKSGLMVKVSVKDNGMGMDEKTMSGLFSQDRVLSMAGTEGETGTGLGLMLCKEFVEKHGGRIWAESRPGQGAAFFFTLPGHK
jgi:PAS domain S-box-containing protein